MDWSVTIRDAGTGAVVFDFHGDRTLDSASIGKLILLARVGNELLNDPGLADIRLDRRAAAPVSDSGIWQHLAIDELSIADIARLVFIASDNLGTNVLLGHFPLQHVRAFRRQLGFTRTDLLDMVRDARHAADPATLSRGTAAELCACMTRIAHGELVSPALSSWLRDGLSLGMDLSMVPAPLGLDPLAHSPVTGGRAVPAVANKTGTDNGIRADVGIITLGSRELTYAALCNYDARAVSDVAALEIMHRIGHAMITGSDTSE